MYPVILNYQKSKTLCLCSVKQRQSFYISLCLIFSFVVFVYSQVDAIPAANDFPTKARAEYVFACMSSNGQSEIMLDKCSCSIDTIAQIIKYDDYVNAETIIRMRQLSGDRINVFRNAEWPNQVLEMYRQAQAEAEVRCF